MNIILNMLLCIASPYEDVTSENVGVRVGFQYESIQLTKILWDSKDISAANLDSNRTITPTGIAAQAKTLMGFGGEVAGEFVLAVPGLPIGIEVNAGTYTSGFSEKDTIINYISGQNTLMDYTHNISSTRLGVLGRIFIRSIPSVYPWIGAGPFVGFNTHVLESGGQSIYNANSTVNFGTTGEIGARIWIPQVPKLSVDALIRCDYFSSSKAVFTEEVVGPPTYDYTFEEHYSQWNVRIMAGVTYAIKW